MRNRDEAESVIGGALCDPFSDRVARPKIERLFVSRHRLSAIAFVALRIEHAMTAVKLAHQETVVRRSGLYERHRLKLARPNVDEREMHLLGIVATEKDPVRIASHRSVTRRERAAVLEDWHHLRREGHRRATRVDGRVEVCAGALVTFAARHRRGGRDDQRGRSDDESQRNGKRNQSREKSEAHASQFVARVT
jgi:hypothetical protein